MAECAGAASVLSRQSFTCCSNSCTDTFGKDFSQTKHCLVTWLSFGDGGLLGEGSDLAGFKVCDLGLRGELGEDLDFAKGG